MIVKQTLLQQIFLAFYSCRSFIDTEEIAKDVQGTIIDLMQLIKVQNRKW